MQGIGAEHPAAPQALELQYKINYSAVLGGPFHLKLSAYDLTFNNGVWRFLTVYSQPCFSANAFAASSLSKQSAESPTLAYGSPVDVHPINGFSHFCVDMKLIFHLPTFPDPC